MNKKLSRALMATVLAFVTLMGPAYSVSAETISNSEVKVTTQAKANTVSDVALKYMRSNRPVEGSKVTESKDIKVAVNGEYVKLSDPIVVTEGRTLLPVRALGDVLGISVDYNSQHKVATAKTDKTYIEVPLCYNSLVIDQSKIVPIDAGNKKVASVLHSSRTYLPVRAISENLGFNIEYFSNEKVVSITTDGSKPGVPTKPTVNLDYSKINPTDWNNPHNLAFFQAGFNPALHIGGQFKTTQLTEAMRPSDFRSKDDWSKLVEVDKKYNAKTILVSIDSLDELPKKMWDSTLASNPVEDIQRNIPTLKDGENGLLRAQGSAQINMTVYYKDGSAVMVKQTGDISKGTTSNGELIVGHTTKDVGYISINTGGGRFMVKVNQ